MAVSGASAVHRRAPRARRHASGSA